MAIIPRRRGETKLILAPGLATAQVYSSAAVRKICSVCILRNYILNINDGFLLPEAIIFRCGRCHNILDVTLEPFTTGGNHSLTSGYKALQITNIIIQYVNSTRH